CGREQIGREAEDAPAAGAERQAAQARRLGRAVVAVLAGDAADDDESAGKRGRRSPALRPRRLPAVSARSPPSDLHLGGKTLSSLTSRRTGGVQAGADLNVRVVGAGETGDALRKALARAGLAERAGTPAAFVCAADDLSRAIAMRELAQAVGPIVALTADAAAAIEAGADDAGSTPDEVARRVAARLKAPRVSLQEAPAPDPAPPAPGKREKPLILVVEDDEDARIVLAELLRPRYDV